MNRRHHSAHLAFHHARRAEEDAKLSLADQLVPVVQDVHAIPTRSIQERGADLTVRSAASSSTSCTSSEESNTCQKPVANSLDIVLAAVIPIAVAIIVLIILHQRHVKKQRLEDLNDKHKSLDFGLDETPAKGGTGPEMSLADAEKSVRKGGRGMSMDMSHSPYLLPGGVHGSTDSLHSLSRSVAEDSIDPYRPVTFVKDDNMSMRSFPRNDGASMMSKSDDRAGLLKNAQRMSQTNPFESPQDRTIPEVQFPEPSHVKPSPSPVVPAPAISSHSDATPEKDLTRDSYFENDAMHQNTYHNEQAATVQQPTVPEIVEEHDSTQPIPRKPTPLRLESMVASVHNPNTDTIYSKTSDYGDGFKITPPSPGREDGAAAAAAALESPAPVPASLGVQKPTNNRISMSLRPLPPMEDPMENPEERANRIRSFYKEYFDDSKPEPQGRYAENEGYEQEYMEGAIFDPDRGHFIVSGQPFADPVTRRAMTPPPRAPPRFRGNPGHAYSGSGGGSGRFTPMSMPRGQSAMSMRTAPKKPLPPPSALHSLPTPAMLKEDSLTLNPADFAPPPTFRDMQAGRRPDSPMGVDRPYSPSVRPHTPLISSFDELAVIPSPHALRKSGTFTSLDFMAPPRFKNIDGGSDAASVRSGASNISPAQMHAVRAGAYRVSRLPKGAVGTRDDMMDALKPSWDLRG